MRNMILAVLLCISTWTAQAQGEFTVRGTVKGVKDSTDVLLFLREGNVGRSIARAKVVNGTFLLKGKTTDNELKKYAILPMEKGFAPMGLELWALPNSDIHVIGEGKNYYTWKVESPIEQQQTREMFIENARGLWDEYQHYSAARNDMMMWGEGERSQRKVLCDSLYKLMNQTSIRIDSCNIELMKRTPVSEVWLDNLSRLAMSSTTLKDYPYKEEAIGLYNKLTEEQKQTEQGKTTHTRLFPSAVVQVGDEMADADLYDLEGKLHHLADLKGKYILLDFWSSACGPCNDAIPEMKEISEEYKDKLAVVSLSTDPKSVWSRASQYHKITWDNWNDLQGQNGLFAKYGVRAIPNYILISPKGKVVKKWTGYADGSLRQMMRPFMDATQ